MQIERKFVIAEFDVGVGLHRNDAALCDYVSGWVEARLADGHLNAIYKKFQGVDLPAQIVSGKP